MGMFWIAITIAVVGLVVWWWSSHKGETPEQMAADLNKDVTDALKKVQDTVKK